MYTKHKLKLWFLNYNGLRAHLLAATLVITISCALLSGCSNGNERCNFCGDSIDRWIYSESGEIICASCFSKDGWKVCVNCSSPYEPDGNYTADGMCHECTAKDSWYCELCENRFAFEHLVDLNNGHFVCANCVTPYFLECDSDLSRQIEENPVFEPFE
ncbi:MAG: hypothetical protein KH339_07925 [Firmicutes bacterium]|nr:hypothetical protein [Bacillota bacterium]